MNGENDRGIDRRTFLKVAGAAGVVGAGGVANTAGLARAETDCPTRRFEGSIAEGGRDVRTYTVQGSDPPAITVGLSSSVDVDLYVTLDGREPTPGDYDRRSRGLDGFETVRIPGGKLRAGQSLGLLVYGYRGSGEYALTVAECDRAAGATPSGGRFQIADARLVQVVEDTHVVNEAGETAATAPDPDLVAGRFTAPVFDLDGTGEGDLETDLQVTVTRAHGGGSSTHSFRYPREMVKRVVRDNAETRGVFHRMERGLGGDGNRPPVFRLSRDNRSVTVELSVPGGPVLDRTTLQRTTDYRVRRIPPLSLGFVPVEDPGGGSNYGNFDGRCMAYRETVDNAIAYLRRVYPGGVVAYRHDDYLTGTEDVREDSKHAEDELDRVRRGSSFPDGGNLYAPGRRRRTVRDRIASDGFDAVVMIVPANQLVNVGAKDYFSYHFPDESFVGYGWTDPEMAVAVRESGGLTSLEIVATITVAHELGHRFVADPYRGRGASHPFAQRDGEDRLGTDAEVDGKPVDFDHARGPKLGDPQVLSTAYDLTDGRFSLVNGFSVGDGELSSHGPRTSLVNLDATPMSSFMSYQWEKKWADSIVYQGILEQLARG